MIRPEFYKIRHHRTPWVIFGIAAALTLAAPVYLAVRPPDESWIYLPAMTELFSAAAALLAPVLGAWVVGHEYRQGTLRRVLAIDARRPRLLAVKGAVGAVTLSVGLAAVAGLGIGACYVAAAINSHTLSFDGSARELLAGGFFAFVTAAVAFGLSIILRSYAFAMLGAIAVMVIFGPLAEMIPTIGQYTPYATAEAVSSWINKYPTRDLSAGTAAATLAATLAAMFAAATVLFTRRDV